MYVEKTILTLVSSKTTELVHFLQGGSLLDEIVGAQK